MRTTRRDFGKLALAALPAASLLAKADSKFGGVQIGTITYSFRALPGSAEEILKYCVELGISEVEMMSDPAEAYAGAPAGPGRGPGGPAGGRGRGRGEMTPEQQAAMKKAADEKTKWRLSSSMDKYKALRRMYNDAGVNIYAFKLPPTPAMSDDEFEYIFQVTHALGANNITMELPTDAAFTKRVGDFGTKHQVYIGYHNHMQVNETSWDVALEQSKYNSINMDAGHFTEAINGSPLPFIKKHHDRITSMHLKDKKYAKDGGGNTEWGKGQVPLKDILQLMKKDKYRFPGNIEFEYDVPAGSTVIAEMAKCLRYCKDALV